MEAISRYGRRLVTIAAAISLATTGGCAYSPYVNWETRLEDGKSVSIQAATNHANMAKGRYQQALEDETHRQTALSNGLIVLGALTLGVGIAKGSHRSDLTKLALIGGTAYTLGTWNSSRPREEIYLEAQIAMTCAVDAIQPFNIDAAEKQAFQLALNDLDSRIKAVVADYATLEAEIGRAQNADAGLLASARSDVAAAKAIVDSAGDVHTAGVKLRQERGRAGNSLINAVDSIGAIVNRALRGTLSDLSALPGVIKGLAASTEIVAPGLGVASAIADRMAAGSKSAADAKLKLQAKGLAVPPLSPLEAAIEKLKLSASGLVSYARRVAGQIEISNAARPLEKLKTCKVEVDTDITLSPNQIVFTEKETKTTKLVRVRGGTGFLSASISKSEPISASPIPHGGKGIEVTSGDKLVAGRRYTVVVEDSAGHFKDLTVVVIAEAAEAPKDGANGPKPAPATQGRSAEDVKTIQAAVCVKQDGVFGPATKFSVQVLQAELTEKADGVVTDSQLKLMQAQVTKRGNCVADRLNYYEGTMVTGDIQAVRKRLGFEDSVTKFDDAMREKIKSAPVAFGDSERDKVAAQAKSKGQLTGLLRAALTK